MFHETRFARFNMRDLEAPTQVCEYDFTVICVNHESTWQQRRGLFTRSSVSENEDWSLEIRLAPTFPEFGHHQRTFSHRTRLARVRMEIAKLVCSPLWFRSRHVVHWSRAFILILTFASRKTLANISPRMSDLFLVS